MDTPVDNQDRPLFIASVLEAYRGTPGTVGRIRAADRKLAAHLFDTNVPLEIVRAALALAALRRVERSDDTYPLEPVRSLHYFRPVIAEILRYPPSPFYLTYLDTKLRERWPAE